MKNKITIFGLFVLLFSFNYVRAANMPPIFISDVGESALSASDGRAQRANTDSGIFISQVQITGGKDNTGQDFVELFNPNQSPANLKGYRLVKRAANAQSDTLVKSWGKDTFIPAKSFYLWANSGYTIIASKPDAASSATISADSGVALRFGANDSGTIISSAAWGKTNNGFINVSDASPGAGQSIQRKDLYSVTSNYYIASSAPHNSSSTDLTAAFAQNQAVQKPSPTHPKPIVTVASTGSDISAYAPSTAPKQDQGLVEGDSTINTSSAGAETPIPFYQIKNQRPTPKVGAVKYLILSGAALLALIFVGWKFYIHKK